MSRLKPLPTFTESETPFDHRGQFAWDATSLSSFKTCARKYYYTIICGYRPNVESMHLTFGRHYATALENHYKYLAEGLSFEDVIRRIVRELLILTKDWHSGDPFKNRENLIRSYVWYFDHFKDDPAEIYLLKSGKPAVELSFKLPIDNELYWCGHIDRLVNYAGDIYVMDQKTSKGEPNQRYFNQFSPHVQMSGYTFAGGIMFNIPVKGVIIDAAKISEGGTEFYRGFTTRTQSQLDEWYDGMLATVEDAHRAHERQSYPMNETSCSDYGGCPFRSICSKSPSLRERFLESNFTVNYWNPLESR